MDDDVKKLVETLGRAAGALIQLRHHAESREWIDGILNAVEDALKPFRPDPFTPDERHVGCPVEVSMYGDYRSNVRGFLRCVDKVGFYIEGVSSAWKRCRLIPTCLMLPHDGSDRQPEDWQGGLVWCQNEPKPMYLSYMGIDWTKVKAYLPAKYIRRVE